MREPYVPLFRSITTSSIWDADGDTCKVWITLMAMADPEGFVPASVGGIAAVARMSVERVRAILGFLEQPDPDSRSPANEGRRIQKVVRGWRVINLEWFREAARREAELARKRRYWESKGSDARREKSSSASSIPVESDCNSEANDTGLHGRHTARRKETYTGEDPCDPRHPMFAESAGGEIYIDSGSDSDSGSQAPAKDLTGSARESRKGRFAPADLEPNETQRVRCQELRFDVDELLRAFKLQEFNRDYSDWPRRFSKWIEDQRLQRDAANFKASKEGKNGERKHGSKQRNHGRTGLETFRGERG